MTRIFYRDKTLGTATSLPPPQEAPKIDIEQLRARLAPHDVTVTESETSALERLIAIAKRDSGQSRRVPDFLLAWWNAGACGSFGLTNLWAVDTALSAAMGTVFAMTKSPPLRSRGP